MCFDEDFEYSGDCVVCDDPVDHSDMGNCGDCGGVFHWSDCGDWGANDHQCNNCKQVNNIKFKHAKDSGKQSKNKKI